MKVHIQLSDSLADKLLEEGLTGLPNDFAETIRNNAVKRSEIIKLVIQRHLAKLEAPTTGIPDAEPSLNADTLEREKILNPNREEDDA